MLLIVWRMKIGTKIKLINGFMLLYNIIIMSTVHKKTNYFSDIHRRNCCITDLLSLLNLITFISTTIFLWESQLILLYFIIHLIYNIT